MVKLTVSWQWHSQFTLIPAFSYNLSIYHFPFPLPPSPPLRLLPSSPWSSSCPPGLPHGWSSSALPCPPCGGGGGGGSRPHVVVVSASCPIPPLWLELGLLTSPGTSSSSAVVASRSPLPSVGVLKLGLGHVLGLSSPRSPCGGSSSSPLV